MTNNYLNLNNSTFSVTEISFSIKNLVEQNYGRIKVKGEISKPSFPSSGHIYFNLKDENSVISAVIWRYNSKNVKINVEEGLEVICSGKISTFSGQSKYQLIVDSVDISGEGTLLKLFEERKKKFFYLGYFEKNLKKKLPFLPRSIAVITSSSGSVLKDIINRISNRFPLKIYLFSVSVQGAKSAQEVSNAIKKINELKSKKKFFDIDVIIIARGGGSVEDLWGFNEESVIIATYESKIPIISAIGHETDTTLLDYVSDFRASTPSAAAEICVPLIVDLKSSVYKLNSRKYIGYYNYYENLKNNLSSKRLSKPKAVLNYKQQKLDFSIKNLNYFLKAKINEYLNNLVFTTSSLSPPVVLLKDHQNNLQILKLKFLNSFNLLFENKLEKFNTKLQLLKANSYQKTLEKGFVIMLGQKNNVIRGIDDININEEAKVKFIDGIAKVKILEK